MLGWLFIVSRVSDEKHELARWESREPRIKWLHLLEEKGLIEMTHNGGGYPNEYAVKAKDIVPIIILDDMILSNRDQAGYHSVTRDFKEIESCQLEEILRLTMWDLS